VLLNAKSVANHLWGDGAIEQQNKAVQDVGIVCDRSGNWNFMPK
jgi:hypothetical protein